MDIREAIENEEVVEFIRKFENKAIGAISIAPLMLLKQVCWVVNHLWQV